MTNGQNTTGHYWTGTSRANPNVVMVGSFRRQADRLVYFETIHNNAAVVAQITSTCEPPKTAPSTSASNRPELLPASPEGEDVCSVVKDPLARQRMGCRDNSPLDNPLTLQSGPEAFRQCSAITDYSQRLACYDKVSDKVFGKNEPEQSNIRLTPGMNSQLHSWVEALNHNTPVAATKAKIVNDLPNEKLDKLSSEFVAFYNTCEASRKVGDPYMDANKRGSELKIRGAESDERIRGHPCRTLPRCPGFPRGAQEVHCR